MSYENVAVETHGRVGLVRMDRPSAMNALSSSLIAEICDAVDTFEQDDEIGCIVITGTDRAFAAGADIKEMLSKEFLDAYFEDFGGRNWQRLVDCRKPIIAAVAGYALGGGCELALMCDIVIAGEDAKFGLPEITLGMMPGMGGTQRLPRSVGKAKAVEMCLTGRMLDAAEAERAGLVGRVVPSSDVVDEA